MSEQQTTPGHAWRDDQCVWCFKFRRDAEWAEPCPEITTPSQDPR